MPCYAATEPEVLVVPYDQSLNGVLSSLSSASVSHALLVNEDGAFYGAVSARSALESLVPVQVQVGGNSIALDSAPGAARRLAKVKPQPASLFVDRDIATVFPHTPISEAARILLSDRKPCVLVVIDEVSSAPKGVITASSLLIEFDRMQHRGDHG